MPYNQNQRKIRLLKPINLFKTNKFILLNVGMLSKSKGQILRIAATLPVLFNLETPLSIPAAISDSAIKAAINLVDAYLQHAAFLAGRGEIDETIRK